MKHSGMRQHLYFDFQLGQKWCLMMFYATVRDTHHLSYDKGNDDGTGSKLIEFKVKSLN